MITTVALLAMSPAAATFTVTPAKTFQGLRVVSVAIAPTGAKFAVGCEDNSVRIINSANMETVVKITGHPQTPGALAFSPDGKKLAVGDETARIIIWNTANGQKVAECLRDKGHTRGIQALAFSRDGRRLASVGKDDVIKVWAATGGNPTGTILGSGANFYGVDFSSTGGLVTGTLAEGIRIYNPSTLAVAAKITTQPEAGSNSVAVNKAGTVAMAQCRDGRVAFYRLSDRTLISRSQGHSDWVMYGAFTPNGKYAFSSSSDRTICAWDWRTGTRVAKIEPASFVGSPMGVTADGKYLVTTNDMDELKLFTLNPPQR
jgi:WD40 repeat protein